MFKGVSAFNEVLFVYGRLKLGTMGVLGAAFSVAVFGGLFCVLLIGWIWKVLSGAPILPGHEIIGGDLDISILLVVPIIWFGFQALKGRVTLTAKEAEDRQEYWQKEHWQLWNADGVYSISATNFVMSMFGVIALLCLIAGLVSAAAFIVQ